MKTNHSPNRLINAKSPYLLQHAYNPIDWFPWGEEALKKAKDEDKPIIVSIGYSACHWCHVMERECFENETIAAVTNQNFISIKVDREERPDVDHLYMDALHLMGLQGGWPLNVFITPDGKPFYGGTYFPPNNWMHLLKEISRAWENNRKELEDSAEKFRKNLNRSEVDRYRLGESNETPEFDIRSWGKHLEQQFDYENGGLQRTPKFPMPVVWNFLLDYGYLLQNEAILNHCRFTLDRITSGGIYDWVEGGITRYSTDGEWMVPHFEKMLYDNGQIISLLTKADSIFSNAIPDYSKGYFSKKAKEIIDFIISNWLSKEGGIYSAYDADSEGIEGKYYTFTLTELQEELNLAEINFLATNFQVQEDGNWEHTNILHRTTQLAPAEYEVWAKIQTKLKKIRSNKIKPGLDDKIICSWNSLFVNGTAFFELYQPQDVAKQSSELVLSFIKTHLYDNNTGNLSRVFKDGVVVKEAFLEDYATTIEACETTFISTGNYEWLKLGKALLEYCNQNFFDSEEGYFWYSDFKKQELIANKKELFDNVIPASNSIMAHNLFRYGHHFENSSWIEQSEKMVRRLLKMLNLESGFLANWARLGLYFQLPIIELSIVGAESNNWKLELQKFYWPTLILITSNGEETGDYHPWLVGRVNLEDKSTKAYICINKTCLQPFNTLEETLDQVNKLIDNQRKMLLNWKE